MGRVPIPLLPGLHPACPSGGAGQSRLPEQMAQGRSALTAGGPRPPLPPGLQEGGGHSRTSSPSCCSRGEGSCDPLIQDRARQGWALGIVFVPVDPVGGWGSFGPV